LRNKRRVPAAADPLWGCECIVTVWHIEKITLAREFGF
jgi:hypothetical protein